MHRCERSSFDGFLIAVLFLTKNVAPQLGTGSRRDSDLRTGRENGTGGRSSSQNRSRGTRSGPGSYRAIGR